MTRPDFSGWRLVPREPSETMYRAAETEVAILQQWEKMLAADPSHPATEAVAALVKAAGPFANLLHDDIVPKNAMEKQLQDWAKALRVALAPFGEG